MSLGSHGTSSFILDQIPHSLRISNAIDGPMKAVVFDDNFPKIEAVYDSPVLYIPVKYNLRAIDALIVRLLSTANV
jgi:hypothetical protein